MIKGKTVSIELHPQDCSNPALNWNIQTFFQFPYQVRGMENHWFPGPVSQRLNRTDLGSTKTSVALLPQADSGSTTKPHRGIQQHSTTPGKVLSIWELVKLKVRVFNVRMWAVLVADVKMEIPVLVRSLKSRILSSTSFQMGKTFWGVVSDRKG